MCANKLYPCYYQYCSDAGSQSGLSLSFKCARGLVFDDKMQKCVWSLPWHSCQSIGVNLDKTENNLEKRLVKTVTKIPSNNSLFNVLSSNEARIAYLSSMYGQLETDETNLLTKASNSTLEEMELTNLNENFPRMLMENSKVFQTDDFNVTIEKENEFELEQDQVQDEYAFIIVPIKLAKINTKKAESSLLKKEKFSYDNKLNQARLKLKKRENNLKTRSRN